MKLSILIVSYNTLAMLRDCLASIYSSDSDRAAEVIVIDNASSDGSPEMVRAEFPAVRLIENNRNVGFAAANNQALRFATGQYVLLLNSDCEVLPGALGNIVRFADEKPAVGMVGPQLLNPDRSLQPSGRRFPTLRRFFMEVTGLYRLTNPVGYFDANVDYSRVREVDELTGAALLVRREAYEQVGLLDENYFFYWEDVDWCRRMKLAGWKVFYFPDAKVIHQFGGSRRSCRLSAHLGSLRGTHYYFRKHHGPVAALAVKSTLIVREVVHLLLAAVTLRQDQLQFRMNSLRAAWRL